jgi:hypothetical protein
MVRWQSFPRCLSGVCILVLSLRGSFVFRLPPYNPSGERMAAISWNTSSFCFAIFLFLLPLEFLGLAWELHGEILWERRMIERQARPCMNLHGMYIWFGVVPQGLVVSLPFLLFGDFRSPFLAACGIFEAFLFGFGGGLCLNPSWFFSLWFPSQICEQRGSILGFSPL